MNPGPDVLKNAALKVESDGAAQSGSYQEILAAAAECFKENGFAATSIDDVARSLNATKGMIYHHFRSKMDLFFAVYRRGMEINFEAVLPYSSGKQSDGDKACLKLAKMSISHAIALMAHQPFQRVLAQGVEMHQTGSTTAAQRQTLDELIRLRNKYEGLFRRAIEAAAQGPVKLPDPSLASKSFLAVLNSTVYWYSPRDKDPQEEQLALATDLVRYAMQGLGLKMPDMALINLETEK